MEQVFLIIHVFIAVALIGIVLIQRSDSDGFGLGSGSGSNFLSGRQTANLMTRATAILATLFILNSLFLSIMAANRANISLVDQIEAAGALSPVKQAVEEKTIEPDGPAVEPAGSPDAAPAEGAATEPAAEVPAEAEAPAVPVAE